VSNVVFSTTSIGSKEQTAFSVILIGFICFTVILSVVEALHQNLQHYKKANLSTETGTPVVHFESHPTMFSSPLETAAQVTESQNHVVNVSSTRF
jgi:hypothetical protein